MDIFGYCGHYSWPHLIPLLPFWSYRWPEVTIGLISCTPHYLQRPHHRGDTTYALGSPGFSIQGILSSVWLSSCLRCHASFLIIPCWIVGVSALLSSAFSGNIGLNCPCAISFFTNWSVYLLIVDKGRDMDCSQNGAISVVGGGEYTIHIHSSIDELTPGHRGVQSANIIHEGFALAYWRTTVNHWKGGIGTTSCWLLIITFRLNFSSGGRPNSLRMMVFRRR